jgi:hypothetical protein
MAAAAAAPSDVPAAGGGGALAEAVTGLDSVQNAQTLLAAFDVDSSVFTARAARVAFWIAVALAITLVVHVLGIVVARLAGWRPPAWLEFPRAELAVLLLCLQPAAQCTGQLVASHEGGFIAGGLVAFLAACGGLLLAGAWLVWHGVHRDASRRARWQALPAGGGGYGSSSASFVKAPRSRCGRLWHSCIAGPLAGFHYPTAEWVHVQRKRHLRFLERHGVLFSDNKGPLWQDIQVASCSPSSTSTVPAASSWSPTPKPVDPDLYVSRAPEKPLLRCCGSGGLHASHLRPHATLLQVAVACCAAFVTVSITEKGGAAGVIAVLAVVVVWLAYLRALTPIANRLEQGLEVASAGAEVITWATAIALLYSPTSSTSYSVAMGWIMIGAQGVALALLVFSRPFAWAPTVRRLWARHRAWRAIKRGGGGALPPAHAVATP